MVNKQHWRYSLIFIVAALLVNVFTLTPFAADGSISGIKSTYVWAFDFLNIIIAIVILMKRGMFKLWMMRLTLLLFCASFFEFTCMFLYKYKFGQ
ncbi:MAG: hypothetical protein ACI91J_002252, partial [Yoonia sp.]